MFGLTILPPALGFSAGALSDDLFAIVSLGTGSAVEESITFASELSCSGFKSTIRFYYTPFRKIDDEQVC